MLKYFAISWSSYKDGPGKRIVLFLCGCPLHCLWCHSPHSQTGEAELLFFEENCKNCGRCMEVCSNGVHKFYGDKHFVNRSNCQKCGSCVLNCSNGALNMQSYEEKPLTVFQKVQPELKLLQQLGGLTISGGEPMLQANEIKELFSLLRGAKANTAIETSGAVSRSPFEQLVDYVDCWLYGLRLTDKALLKAYTGADFDLVYENLHFLATENPNNIIIRTPIIPNHNDTVKNFYKIAEIMVSLGLKKIELLPFNPFTSHYYKALGKTFDLIKFTAEKEVLLDEIIGIFTEGKIDVKLV